VKVVVADNDLPSVEWLVGAFEAARRAGRTVAVHCVTRVGLVLALAAWEQVPAVEGDRIEHGSVLPVELLERIRELGLCVVTQPGFVADRGDRYLAEVEHDDQPHLYRCASLLAAGIPVAGSTDAPFGPDDPWLAMRAAVDRRTRAGALLGPDEAVEPARALELFLGAPTAPGTMVRRVAPGAAADLCLLGLPLAPALHDLSASAVRACWIGGRLAAGSP
jgi:predicted amidohydrolase YtcJ